MILEEPFVPERIIDDVDVQTPVRRMKGWTDIDKRRATSTGSSTG